MSGVAIRLRAVKGEGKREEWPTPLYRASRSSTDTKYLCIRLSVSNFFYILFISPQKIYVVGSHMTYPNTRIPVKNRYVKKYRNTCERHLLKTPILILVN